MQFSLEAYQRWKDWHNDKDQEFYKENGKYLDEATDSELVKFQLGVKNESEQVLTQQTVVNRAHSEEEKILRMMQSGVSRLEQTFATFSEYPELLSTSSRERLFELNMFKQGELFKRINEQPAFARELLEFAKNNIELARGTRDIKRALFFVQLRDNLKEYVQLSDIPENEKQIIISEFPSSNDYSQLLDICLNDQETRAVYAAHLTNYLHQIETRALNFDELTLDQKNIILTEIVKGYFLYKSLDPGLSGQNPEADKQIQYLLTRVRPQLTEMFESEKMKQSVLQDLFKLLKLNLSNNKFGGKFPRITQGAYTIDFDKGFVFDKGKANGLLPPEIFEDEAIQRLFKDKKTGEMRLSSEAQLEFKIDPKTMAEVIVYTFKQQPNLRLIQQSGQNPIIQMKMYGKPDAGWMSQEDWYELTPFQDPNKTGGEDTEHQLPGEISDLVLGRFVWRELNNPSHLVVKDESNTTYLYNVQLKNVDQGWQLKEVKRFKDNLILVNPWKVREQLGSLTAIEDAAHIKVWGTTSQEVKEFEFPRIKTPDGSPLAYRTKQVTKQGKVVTVLESVQSNGFIMPFQPSLLIANVPHDDVGVEILPHMFKDFQLLMNPRSGAKKVLIPLQKATRTGSVSTEAQEGLTKYAHWSDQVKLDHSAQSWGNQTVLEFEVDLIKSSLKSDNKQANLFLAYLFFTNKRYEQALEFLIASETSLPMSISHSNI